LPELLLINSSANLSLGVFIFLKLEECINYYSWVAFMNKLLGCLVYDPLSVNG